MTIANDNKSMIPGVQYLRGVAALMVVLFHSSPMVRNFIGMTTLAWGEFGVDIFFNISGFVMMHSVITAEKSTSSIAFIKNRLIRIGPMYWLMTSLMTCILIIKPTAFNSAVLSMDHYALSMLFIPHFHPGIEGAVLPMLVPGWTLSYEMYFYIVFSAALLLPHFFLFGWVLGVLAVVNIIARSGFIEQSATSMFLGNSIVYEFTCGMFIALLSRRGIYIPKWFAVIALPLASSLIIFASSADNRFVTVGLSATIILYSTLSFVVPTKKVVLSFFRLLGDSSYSLYLSHVFVIGLVSILWRKVFAVHAIETYLSAVLYLLLCCASSITVGALLYKGVEIRLTRWIKFQLRS